MACGTGASAVCVAAAHKGLANRDVTISLHGGELHLDWSESNNRVYKTGPSQWVYSGTLDYDPTQ